MITYNCPNSNMTISHKINMISTQLMFNAKLLCSPERSTHPLCSGFTKPLMENVLRLNEMVEGKVPMAPSSWDSFAIVKLNDICCHRERQTFRIVARNVVIRSDYQFIYFLTLPSHIPSPYLIHSHTTCPNY